MVTFKISIPPTVSSYSQIHIPHQYLGDIDVRLSVPTPIRRGIKILNIKYWLKFVLSRLNNLKHILN